MSLRNVLLFISIFMVGFCAILYFQTGQTVQTMNWDQYKNLQYNEERSHSLHDLNQKLLPYDLVEIIDEVQERNRLAGIKTRVMEIGAGNGRVLMELRKKFPNVEFYGINKEKTRTFYRRESFVLTALKFEIYTKEDIEQIELPYIVFEDLDFGAKIPYDENKFDVIYSQSTIKHIKYKFELFNEILRVLRPGGISLHTDITGLNVYSKGIILDPRDALAEIRRRGIEIHLLEDKESLRFKKSNFNALFPVTPHQKIPEKTETLSKELRRPEMGYNINL